MSDEKNLYQLAYTDSITGLGNYNYFIKKISENNSISKTIVIIDIDKFKAFNKKYGHSQGDKLLKKVGEEIKLIIRKTDIVCRLANDVFGIVLFNDVETSNIIGRINKRISKVTIENVTYNIKVSIGIYRCNSNEKPQSMIDKAIMAHDSIKGNYNEIYGEFTEQFAEKVIRESEIENLMVEGLEKREFEVYYQPLYRVKDNSIIGAEALVRWNNKGTLIPPKEFISVFEKNFFIIKLDKYVYEKVCNDLATIKEKIKRQLLLSVNISKESISERDFIENYIKINEKYNIEPGEIQFEITERTSVGQNIKEVLSKIKEAGFRIAIDDFGTGYSSLSLLANMPIDTIKIDKTFIDKIEQKDEDMIEIIMLIAKKLKLKTVAEGVENQTQVDFLKENQCDILQGYFLSKPIKFKEFRNLIV
ncbi:MAG: putative bifunctional diguanylate cyclase/phosphodiesterase [Clostridia bacterium]